MGETLLTGTLMQLLLTTARLNDVLVAALHSLITLFWSMEGRKR